MEDVVVEKVQEFFLKIVVVCCILGLCVLLLIRSSPMWATNLESRYVIRGPLKLSVVGWKVPFLILSVINMFLNCVKVSDKQIIFMLPLSAGIVMICLFLLKNRCVNLCSVFVLYFYLLMINVSIMVGVIDNIYSFVYFIRFLKTGGKSWP